MTSKEVVAKWLRANGFPEAEPSVGEGNGELTGTPGVVWQIADQDIDQDAVLSRRMADIETQRSDAAAGYGVLVERRRDIADPGRWWAHWLMDDGLTPTGWLPVRTTLANLVVLLLRCAYGDWLNPAHDQIDWDTQQGYTAEASQDNKIELNAATEDLA